MGKKKKRRYDKLEQATLGSQDIIKEFYRKILMMQEEEKRRISRDLHDETGQMIIALGAGLNVIEKEIKAGNLGEVSFLLNENRKMIQDIADRLKAMALNLRPPALDLLGLAAVLREYFSQCTKSHPIKIEFNENLKDIKIDEDVEITLYRIIQEATSNIIEHSMATTARIGLIFEGKEIKLLIEDNGKGFDAKEVENIYDVNKMGLHGIRERVKLLNGNFSLESAPNEGTKLTIAFPLEK